MIPAKVTMAPGTILQREKVGCRLLVPRLRRCLVKVLRVADVLSELILANKWQVKWLRKREQTLLTALGNADITEVLETATGGPNLNSKTGGGATPTLFHPPLSATG